MTILDKLAAHAKERTETAKSKVPLEEMKKAALSLPKGDFKFENALRSPDISFICECKKASPSKGLIAPDFPYLEIAMEYESAMIYEAKTLGASAVLLICSILTEEQIEKYIAICGELGMSALVEAHDEAEVSAALKAGARIIGVNNRNLRDFSIDTENSRRLRELIPEDILFVSESGVRSAADVEALRAIGADAVLIGETLMRAADKKAKLKELRGIS